MLNKMDKFDIFVPHPLTNTFLLIQLPSKCECKPLVYLLKRPTLLSVDFQDRSIRDYSSCTLVGCRKQRVKQKSSKRKKKHLIDYVFK